TIVKLGGFQSRQQLLPCCITLHAKSDVIDTRRLLAGWMIGFGLDQMHYGFIFVIQPVSFKTERRSRAIAEADDIAKEVAHIFQVRGDDSGVIDFHLYIVSGVVQEAISSALVSTTCAE